MVGVPDDAATSMGALPFTTITREVDLVMSALAVSALGGNAGAVLVLSHILRQVPLDHPFASELPVSWLLLNLRRALGTKASAARQAVANRHQGEHQTALHAGDLS